MTKSYNHKSFTFVVDGVEYYFSAYSTSTRTGFCHHIWYNDVHTRVSYYNRTWESFDYESALRSAFNKFPKAVKEGLNKACDKYSGEYNKRVDEEFKPLIAMAKIIGEMRRA